MERRGVPALAVMTETFVSAAQVMAGALGAEDYAFAVIDHPVSSASDAQLRERARRTAEVARKLLLSSA